MMRKNTVLALVLFCLAFAKPGFGQYIFDPVDTVFYSSGGETYPWRIKPRIGHKDTSVVGLAIDPNLYADPALRTSYYVSSNLPGFFEFLPAGYFNPVNKNKLYPLILFLPGCGEVQNGMFYINPPTVNSQGVLLPASPNLLRGMGKFFGQFGYFPAVPTGLRDNGSYFSAVPQKTPGQVFNMISGPREGFIVMALMYRGENGLCAPPVRPPNRRDMDSAIDLALKLYRVDPQRIYMTGLSQGGVQSWDFPSSVTKHKLAAAVPVCSYGDSVKSAARVSQIVANQTHIFSITNSYDYNTNGTGVDVITLTEKATSLMEADPQAVPYLTKLHFLYDWQPPGLNKTQVLEGAESGPYKDGYQTHDAWYRAYGGRFGDDFEGGRPAVYFDPATNDPYTVYEWMLLKRNLSVTVVLPVHVTSFTATRADEGVELAWVTATESNSDEFILERSETGDNFVRMATLPAAGNSSVQRNYRYLDQKTATSKYVYYRLLQRDRDGKLQVIGIRRVFMGLKGMSARVYPNIANTTTVFEVEGVLREKMELRIVDVSGRTVMRQVVPARQARTVLDVSKLQKGFYFIEAQNQDMHQTIKFVKN